MQLSFSNKSGGMQIGMMTLALALIAAMLPAPLWAQDKDGGAGTTDDAPGIVVQVAPEMEQPEEDKTDHAAKVVIGGDALPVAGEIKKQKAPVKVRSLFFSAKDMASIRKAVGVYTRITGEGGNAMDFLKRLQGKQDTNKPGMRYFVYPQFFLASLVYNTPEDWTVYVNNQRLTTKSPEGIQGIRVKEIDKDKVTFEWIPSDWRKVEDVWSVTSNKKVQVDMRQGKVVFTLRPNQTFSSYVMQVLEGRVMPMVLDLSPKNKEGKDGKLSLDGKPSGPSGAPTERDFLDNLLGRR